MNLYLRGFALTFFLACSLVNIFGQAPQTFLLGVITDELTQLPVEGALIYEKYAQKGVETDEKGHFQLEVNPGKTLEIIIRRVGYEQTVVIVQPIEAGTVKQVDISLEGKDAGVEVTIIAESIGDRNMVRANVEEFKLLPSVSGNIESLLPAIALGTSGGSGGELTSQYNVRGGNYDENLVYVNDFEIFRPQLIRIGQQEGLSFPNIDLIRDLAFSSGGFETKYGDKMSSVLDIKYKRPDKTKGSIMGSLLGASAHLEGSFKPVSTHSGKVRYLLGARYKTTRYLLGSLDVAGEYLPNFTDIQGYVTYDFHRNFQLGLIGNLNQSTYNFTPVSTEVVTGGFFFPHKFSADFEGQEKDRFTNNMAGASLTFVPTSKKNPAFIKLLTAVYNGNEVEAYDILSYFKVTKLELDLEGGRPKEVGTLGNGTQHNYARNQLQNILVNAELKGGIELPRYHDGYETSHFLYGGIKVQREHFRDRINEWARTDSAGYSLPNDDDFYFLNSVYKTANNIVSNRITGFLQETFTYKKDGGFEVQATVGSRFGYWSFNDEWIISPRGQFLLRPIGRRNPITYKIAGGIYRQQPFYREMRRLDGSLNEDIRAQSSAQAIGGITYDFHAGKRNPVKLRLITEFYYKKLWDQISYNVDNVRIRYSGENDSRGYAQGLDVRLNGEFVTGFESWLNLSFLRTRESIDGVQHRDVTGAFTDDVARPTDQFFTGALYFQDYLPMNKNFRTNLQLTYGTGLPYGPPVDNLVRRNAVRYKAYQRVDIGFSYMLWDESRRDDKPRHLFRFTRNVWLSLEVFNLMDINNVASVNWIKDFNNIYYYFPNNLTSRRVNLKMRVEF